MTSALRFIEPQLASPVNEPPEGKRWIHEIKHDGYRTLLIIEGKVRHLAGAKYLRHAVVKTLE